MVRTVVHAPVLAVQFGDVVGSALLTGVAWIACYDGGGFTVWARPRSCSSSVSRSA